MSKRSKRFLTILLCAGMVGNLGCTTTAHRLGPSRTAPDESRIGMNTEIINWYVNQGHPRVVPAQQSRQCKVARRVHASIMMYANPGFAAVYLADYLNKKASK